MEHATWDDQRRHYWEVQRAFRYATIAAIEEMLPAGYPLPLHEDTSGGYYQLSVDFAETLADGTIDRLNEMLMALEFSDWHEAKSYLFREDYRFIITGKG